jgi:hypothetical protein
MALTNAPRLFATPSFCIRMGGVDVTFTDLFNTMKRADYEAAIRLNLTDSFCSRIGADL